jgi:hypothetical protein
MRRLDQLVDELNDISFCLLYLNEFMRSYNKLVDELNDISFDFLKLKGIMRGCNRLLELDYISSVFL